MSQSQADDRRHRSCIVIACGGDGSRIGGEKPLRQLDGKPLAHWMVSWAKAQSEHVALAVRVADQVDGLALPLLLDAHRGIGPISALASSFDFALAAGCEWVLLVGCDQPFLPTDLLERLSAAIGDACAAMPVYEGQDQPLATLWRVNPTKLGEYISSDKQSLWRFAEEVRAQRVQWSGGVGENPFFNINDRAALAEAERRLKNAGR